MLILVFGITLRQFVWTFAVFCISTPRLGCKAYMPYCSFYTSPSWGVISSPGKRKEINTFALLPLWLPFQLLLSSLHVWFSQTQPVATQQYQFCFLLLVRVVYCTSCSHSRFLSRSSCCLTPGDTLTLLHPLCFPSWGFGPLLAGAHLLDLNTGVKWWKREEEGLTEEIDRFVSELCRNKDSEIARLTAARGHNRNISTEGRREGEVIQIIQP